jgi:hypothetical protein
MGCCVLHKEANTGPPAFVHGGRSQDY